MSERRAGGSRVFVSPAGGRAAGAVHVVPLADAHRPEAEALARAGLEVARARVPALPADATLPGLGHFVGNGMGVAAVADGAVVGFLGAYAPFDDAFGVPGLRGTFTPVEAVALAEVLPRGLTRGALVARLYTEAAALWTARGAMSHAIAVWAHDAPVTDALFRLGFGMRCAEAVADARGLAALPQAGVGVTVSEASEVDLDALVPLAEGLVRHLNGSPSFMVHREDCAADLRRQVREGARFHVAALDGVPVAYLRTSATGESFVTEHPAMRSVTGAFCVERLRGTGVMEALLGEVARECVRSGETLLGVDFETLNPAAERFWLKRFTPYTTSLVRRLDR